MKDVVCQVAVGGVAVGEAGTEAVLGAGLTCTLLSALGATDDAGVAVWTTVEMP
jgi:hypothetical protein